MKLWILAPLVLMTVGCSGGNSDSKVVDKAMPEASHPSGSQNGLKPEEDGSSELKKFGDDVFKVAPYPGATIVKYTSLEMNMDKTHSYNRHYRTTDSVDKVIEHYTEEGKKVGKLADMSIGNQPGAMMRVLLVELNDDQKLQVQVTKVPKDNSTDISVHLIESKK